jgi:hypothetical protein
MSASGRDGLICECWPGTPVPNTLEWSERCCAELCRLDSALLHTEARILSDDMATEMHWRALQPEAASVRLFEPMSRYQDRDWR